MAEPRIELWAEQDTVTADDVVGLWTREGGLPLDEARRRVSEILLVGIADDRPVGISTAYLEHNAQLRLDFWYVRAFVAAGHRMTFLAQNMTMQARNMLIERHAAGDARAAGVAMEVENTGLKRKFNHALWQPLEFLFVGDNARGDHVRVYPFAGVPAPAPPL